MIIEREQTQHIVDRFSLDFQQVQAQIHDVRNTYPLASKFMYGVTSYMRLNNPELYYTVRFGDHKSCFRTFWRQKNVENENRDPVQEALDNIQQYGLEYNPTNSCFNFSRSYPGDKFFVPSIFASDPKSLENVTSFVLAYKDSGVKLFDPAYAMDTYATPIIRSLEGDLNPKKYLQGVMLIDWK